MKATNLPGLQVHGRHNLKNRTEQFLPELLATTCSRHPYPTYLPRCSRHPYPNLLTTMFAASISQSTCRDLFPASIPQPTYHDVRGIHTPIYLPRLVRGIHTHLLAAMFAASIPHLLAATCSRHPYPTYLPRLVRGIHRRVNYNTNTILLKLDFIMDLYLWDSFAIKRISKCSLDMNPTLQGIKMSPFKRVFSKKCDPIN
ncbi:hypothetical protein [Legionella wadsworthii]|uniref:hypothetical protein n=1 Tax=Legionella wadsworthii TaxID=28088 RepID=UPI000AC3C8EF|nr:hypothetical protein [Legionella wadsworthii]